MTEAAAPGQGPAASLRLDKWLWFARFFKSRTTAAEFCTAGKIRLSHQIVTKAHQPVRPGDVLTFPLANQVRVIRVKALASRRGPFAEACRLYEDLALPERKGAGPSRIAVREHGAGRPTKKERRSMARLTGRA